MNPLYRALDIELALLDGYRVTIHDQWFPYESLDPEHPGMVHASVDHGVRAIFCSREFYEKLMATMPKKATA